MQRNFITTIEVYPENLNTKISDHILDLINKKYKNKCFEGHYIRKINSIIRRGALLSPRNDFSGILTCDVQFSAECISYECGDLLTVTVTELNHDSIICKTEEYIVYLKAIQNFKPKKASKFICIIKNISYESGSHISMTASVFKPFAKTQVIEVVNVHEQNDTITQSTSLCVSKIAELQNVLQKCPYATEVNALLYLGFNKRPKMVFDKHLSKQALDIKKIPEGPIYFIINPVDSFAESEFRLAPITSSESMLSADFPAMIRKDGSTLQTIFYKNCVSICNYLECLISLSSFESKAAFENNNTIWDFYKSTATKI